MALQWNCKILNICNHTTISMRWRRWRTNVASAGSENSLKLCSLTTSREPIKTVPPRTPAVPRLCWHMTIPNKDMASTQRRSGATKKCAPNARSRSLSGDGCVRWVSSGTRKHSVPCATHHTDCCIFLSSPPQNAAHKAIDAATVQPHTVAKYTSFGTCQYLTRV